MLRAIAGVFAHAGKGVQPATVTRARVEISDALASTPDDGVRAAAALALAHVASWLTEDERVQLIEQLGEHDDGVDAETREGRAAALSRLRACRPNSRSPRTRGRRSTASFEPRARTAPPVGAPRRWGWRVSPSRLRCSPGRDVRTSRNSSR